ncbi:TPA: YSIRK-type signal peptide-containing protein [Streptococcus pyogenes]|nr:YSIRK-type signal peptide-containing protein [Streptococcus pyogenes]
MARKDTNKQYSLRKLKTGTASVAVAVAVLGAGFANQTTVKADSDNINRSVSVKDNEKELHNKIADLEEERGEHLDKIDELKEELKAKEKSSENVERHYLRKLDQEYKEQD